MTKERSCCVYLYVMVTPEEQALIGERMAEVGISNMEDYMRQMALNGYALNCPLEHSGAGVPSAAVVNL